MDSTYRRCGLAGLAIVLFVFLLSPTVGALPLNAFIPFGQSAGDTRLAVNDDGSSGAIGLSTPFLFFSSAHSSLFVNNNGNVTFDRPLSTFTSFAFPSTNQIIAPYFADVDTRGSPDVGGDGLNDVYCSERRNPANLRAISTIINRAFGGSFLATSAFVATWDHVGYFGAHTNLLNTFQVVLATDGGRSFVIFHYLDNGMTWETGDASGGSGGFGGTQALAGFDAGDNVNFFAILGSRLAGIANILQNGSNIGVPGQWVFQVNGSIRPPNVFIGDVDDNGTVNAVDARLILEVLVGLNPSAAVHFASAGDVNADGVLDNRDAVLILAIVAGRIPPPPDQRRITVTDNLNATVTITGSASAVPPGSTVDLRNTTTGATVSVLANPDGSFGGTLAAVAGGNTLVIDVGDSPARIAFTVQVAAPNRPPAPTAPPIFTGQTQPGTSQVAANDPDVGQTQTFRVSTPPARGTATVTASGLATYTSRALCSLSCTVMDSFVVTVTDNGTPPLSGTVSIAVTVTVNLLGSSTADRFDLSGTVSIAGTVTGLPLYDDFSAATLDPTKWRVQEFVREIESGQLVSTLAQFGNQWGDSVFNTLNVAFSNPVIATTFQADVSVTNVSNTGAVALATLRRIPYNDGTPGGGRTGDICMSVEIRHVAPGAGLTGEAFVQRCNDSTCGASTLVANHTFGPVSLGTTHRLAIDLDGNPATPHFIFGFDGQTFVFDPTAAGAPIVRLPLVPEQSLGTTIFSIDSPAAGAFITATFDNVAFNGAPFDDFSSATLDRTKWLDLEFVRRIEHGQFVSALTRFGSHGNNALVFFDPNTGNAFEADVTVTEASNTAAFPLARLVGFFYNDGTPGGGQAGEIQADIGIRQNGTALEVVFEVGRCGVKCATDPFTTIHFDNTTFGPVALGETHKLFLAWDGTMFTFGFDSAKATFNPTSSAPVASPSHFPFKALATRITGIGSSNAGGSITARFDTVSAD